MKNRNREQWTFAVSLVFGLLLVLPVFMGDGSAGDDEPETTGVRIYQPFGMVLPPRDGEFVSVTKVFKGLKTTRQGLPVLPFPLFRPPEKTSLPYLSPAPSSALRLALDVEVPFLYRKTGLPLIDPGAVLPSPEAVSLSELPEPEMPAPPVHRDTREREFDHVEGKIIYVGVIEFEDEKGLRINTRDKGVAGIAREEIRDIKRRWTYGEFFEYRRDRLDPTDAGGHFELARWCLETEAIDKGNPTGEKLNMVVPEAMSMLRKTLSIQPDHEKAIVLLGDLLEMNGEYEEAVALYSDALAGERADRCAMLVSLGRCFEVLSVAERARRCFWQAWRFNPLSAEARYGVARMDLVLGDFARAARGATEALDRVGDKRPEIRVLRAEALLRAGKLADARKDVEHVLGLQPENGRALLISGVLLAMEGKFSDSAARFAAAIRADGYLVEAWNNLGLLQLTAGKRDDAGLLFEAATRRDPSCVDSFIGAMLALDEENGFATLMPVVREMAPDARYPDYLQGHQTLVAGDPATAEPLLRRACENDYQDLPRRYAAAHAAFSLARGEGIDGEEKAGRLARAEALLLDVDEKDAHILRALIRLERGRNREAQELLLKLLRSGVEDPVVAYALGWLVLGEKDREPNEKVEEAVRDFFRPGSGWGERFGDPVTREAAGLCATWMKRLTDWNLTRVILNENFNRADGPDLGNKWIELDKAHGISVVLRNGMACFEGRQVNKDMGLTSIEYVLPGEGIYIVEGTLCIEEMKEAECGMSVYFDSTSPDNRRGAHIGRSAEGGLFFSSMGFQGVQGGRNMKGSGWRPFKNSPAVGDRVRIRFRRSTEEDSEKFFIDVWDGAANAWVEVQQNIHMRGKEGAGWRVAFWGRGYKNREYSFGVDDVRVFERRER